MKVLGISSDSILSQSIDSVNKSKFSPTRRKPANGLSLAEIQSIVSEAVQSVVTELKQSSVVAKHPLVATSKTKAVPTSAITKVDIYDVIKRPYANYHRNPFSTDFARLLDWCRSISVDVFCVPNFPQVFTQGLGIGLNGAFCCAGETHSEIWIDLGAMRSLDALLHMDSEMVVKLVISHELGHIVATRLGARLDSHALDEKLAWAYARTIVENNYSMFRVSSDDFQRFSSHFVKV